MLWRIMYERDGEVIIRDGSQADCEQFAAMASVHGCVVCYCGPVEENGNG